MSIAFHLPTAFGSNRKAFSTAAADRLDEIEATLHAKLKSGQMRAAPWEGLYLEPPEGSAYMATDGCTPNLNAF